MRTANRLTATSIRDFILGSGLNFFGYNFQKQISKSSKKSFVVILWLNFALVTFRSCAVMYRNVGYWDHSCWETQYLQYGFGHWTLWPKCWHIKIICEISNKLFSFWVLKIALADLKVLEKRCIMWTVTCSCINFFQCLKLYPVAKRGTLIS